MLSLRHTHGGGAPKSPCLPRQTVDQWKNSEREQIYVIHLVLGILQGKTEVEVLPVVDLIADSASFFFVGHATQVISPSRPRRSTYLIEGPGKKGNKKEKFTRLAQAFFIRVADSSRNFDIFLSHACMKCPLQRRHHERYSESRAVKNRMIRTNVFRPIEGARFSSIRWNMWEIYYSE